MSQSESAAGGGSSVEYIQHHLTNWCVGDCDPVTHQATGFWAFHVDTIFFSFALAIFIVVVVVRLACFLILDFVSGQVRDTFPGHNPLIGPLALTIFVWVWLMNFMDLIPVDLLPLIASWFGIHYLKVVPTTDLNTTLAMSLTVFLLIIFYNIMVMGPVGYLKLFLFHPFGKFFVPVNIVMSLIEEVAKPLSLALRLFGNLFAGELVFLLIALLGVTAGGGGGGGGRPGRARRGRGGRGVRL